MKAIGIFILAIFYTLISSAQQDSALITLDEVLISAKDMRLLDKQASTVSVFRVKQLDQLQINQTKDLTSKVPNLYMPDYGSKLTSPIFIRGIGSLRNAPSVGLYVDGIPYMEKNTYDIDLSEVALLEVLRGPQGTLYGRNTMGGIINIHTKSAFTWQGTQFSQLIDNYEGHHLKLANYALINPKLALTTSLRYKVKQGYFENTFSGDKADKLKDGGGRFKLSYQMTDRHFFELSSNLNHSKQYGYAYGQIPVGADLPDLPNYNQASYYQQTLSSTGLRYRYSTPNIILSTASSFQWFDDDQHVDQDFTVDSVFYVVQKQKQAMFSQEFTVRSNHSSPYQWLVGAFAFYQSLDNSVYTDQWKKKLATNKPYKINTKGAAVYHQSDIKNVLIQGLDLGLGVRLDVEKSDIDHVNDSIFNNGNIVTNKFVSDLDFVQFVPKINLQYRFNVAHQIHVSVAKGYKTGGFNTTFDRDSDRSFDPESSINYELAYRFKLFNQLTGCFNVFYIDWDNQQITRTNPSGRGQILKNAGATRSSGVELSLNWEINKQWDIDLQYGHTNAVFVHNQLNDSKSYDGNYLPYIPANTVSLTTNYAIVIDKYLQQIQLMLQYNGTGQLYWDEANVNKQSYYQVLHGRIGFQFAAVNLNLWARNLTDTQYNAYLFNVGTNRFAQRGQVFSYGLGLNLVF